MLHLTWTKLLEKFVSILFQVVGKFANYSYYHLTIPKIIIIILKHCPTECAYIKEWNFETISKNLHYLSPLQPLPYCCIWSYDAANLSFFMFVFYNNSTCMSMKYDYILITQIFGNCSIFGITSYLRRRHNSCRQNINSYLFGLDIFADFLP